VVNKNKNVVYIYMKLVHFFFLEIGLGKLEDHPLYLNNIAALKKLNPETEVIIWDEEKLDELVNSNYTELLEIWNNFPSTFYKIDFGRYLVLKKHGGAYFDLDVECIKKLPDEDEMDFINVDYWWKFPRGEKFNCSILYFRDPKIYDEIIEFSVDRIRNFKLPRRWGSEHRYMHTVAARMYDKFCYGKGMKKTAITEYVRESYTTSWKKVKV
jgi:hypothetical protein